MSSLDFEILARDADTGARSGRLHTGRGVVRTPAFMPVATLGSVKGVLPQTLRELGAEIVLANAYHLHLRPGAEVVRDLGGLSEFMGWGGPVLTDSGGFQLFSLSSRVDLGEDSVVVKSHLDGRRIVLTPAGIVDIQGALGVDVLMPLDDCPPYPSSPARLVEAVDRSARWLGLSKAAWGGGPGALFGIVQGGVDPDLRERSLEATLAIDLPGYAVGGLSVGEPTSLFHETAHHTVSRLPDERPRYLMGAGLPEDLLELVGQGYDLFDCVLPTRNARNGTLFTSVGRRNVRNARFARDSGPADPNCDCSVCRRFTLGYLRHLAVSGEILSCTLNSIHNLAFYLRLMREMREALETGAFPEYRARTLERLRQAGEET